MPLRIIGCVYVLSAIWCTLMPELAAQGLGLSWTEPHGKVEFLSVYGGLQLGLGVAMFWLSMRPKLLFGVVFFATIFSSVLAMSRLIHVLMAPMHGMLLALLVLEVAIALYLLWYGRRLTS